MSFDELIDDTKVVDDTELSISSVLSADIKPAQESELIQMSETDGYDLNFLRALRPDQLRGLKAQKILDIKEDSLLRGYFSKPEAAAISMDDIPILTQIEEGVKSIPLKTSQTLLALLDTAPRALVSGFRQGQLITESGIMGTASTMPADRRGTLLRGDPELGNATGAQIALKDKELQSLNEGMKELGYDESWIVAGANSFGEMIGQGYTAVTKGNTGVLMGAGAVAGGLVALGTISPLVPFTLPIMATMASGAVTGAAVGMVADTYVVEAGHLYTKLGEIRDFEGKPIPEINKKLGAMAGGAVNALITSTLGITGIKSLAQMTPAGKLAVKAVNKIVAEETGKALLNASLKKTLVQIGANWGKGTLAGTFEEVLQEITPVVVENVVKRISDSSEDNYFVDIAGLSDFLGVFSKENMRSYFEVAKKEILGGGIMGAGPAMMASANAGHRVRKAKMLMEKITEANELIGKSQTLKHSKAQAVKAIKAVGLNQEVWINADDMEVLRAQDPEVLKELGLDDEMVDKAIKEGNELAVNIADVAVLNPEQSKAVNSKIRGEVSDMSAAEAANFKASEEIQNITKVIETLNDEDSKFSIAMEKIKSEVSKIADKKGWDNAYAGDVAQTIESFAYRNAITEKTDLSDFVSRLEIKDVTDKIANADNLDSGTLAQIIRLQKMQDVIYSAKELEARIAELDSKDMTEEERSEREELETIEQLRGLADNSLTLDGDISEIQETELSGRGVEHLFAPPRNEDQIRRDARRANRSFKENQAWAKTANYLKNVGIQLSSAMSNFLQSAVWAVTVDADVSRYIDNYNKFREEGSPVLTEEHLRRVTGLYRTYYQANQKRIAGQVEIRGIKDNEYFIRVFNDANLSTILHELGHVFLAETQYLAKQKGASARIKSDMARLEQWFKAGKNKKINSQELFARAFEQYLRNGKTPVPELSGAFGRYKKWLKTVYKTTKDIQKGAGFEFTLNSGVASVFDRMLASEVQIEQAAMETGIVIDDKSLDELDLTEAEKSQVGNLLTTMRENATSRLQWEKERGDEVRTREWKKQATEAAAKDKAIMTRAAMKKTPISKPMLVAAMGKEATKNGYQIGMVSNDSTIDPNLAALEAGYDSLAEMTENLTNSPTQNDFIKNFVEAKRAEYEANLDPATELLIDEGKSSEYLEAVGEYLARKTKVSQDQKSARFLKQWADAQIGMEMVNESTSPAIHIQKFQAAMKREKAAFTKGDFPTALQELNIAREQMAKAQSARRAKKFVDIAVKRKKKQVSTKQPIDGDLASHLEHILAKLGIISRAKLKPLGRPINEVIQKYFGDEDSAVMPLTPPAMEDGIVPDTGVKSYRKELTLDEFRQMTAFTDWLYNFGRKIKQGILATTLLNRVQFAEKLINGLDELSDKAGLFPEGSMTRAASDLKEKALANVIQPQFMFKAFDAYKDDGAHTSLIWNEMNKQLNKAGLHLDAIQKRMEPMAKYFDAKAKNFPSIINTQTMGREMPPVSQQMKKFNRPWTFENALVLALNQGTESNKKAVMEGYDLDQTGVDQLLSIFGEDEDWDNIQEMLNVVNDQWKILSPAYEQVNLVKPPKIEANEFTVMLKNGKTKKLEGGYYPIKFDRDLSLLVDDRAEFTDIMNSINASFFNVKVPAPFMKKRKGSGALPVSLKLRDLSTHLKFTTHYGFMSPILNDIDQVTRDTKYKNKVIDKFGAEQYKLISPVLKKVARGDGDPTANWAERTFGSIKAMTTAAILGAKLMIATKQAYSVIPFARRFGPLNTFKGYVDFITDARSNYGEAQRLSHLMKNRGSFLDQDIGQMLTIGDPKRTKLGKTLKVGQDTVFVSIQFVDSLVAFPIWHMAFKEGQTMFSNEADAVQYADNYVTSTQPATRVQDRSAFQSEKKGPLIFFNFFKGWTLKYGNQLIYNTAGAAKGKISAIDFAKFVMMDMLFAPTAMHFMVAALKQEDTEPEDVLAGVINYQFAGFPIMGDLVNYASLKVRGDRTFGLFSSPVALGLRYVENFGNAVTGEDNGKAKRAAWSMAELMSFYLKVPATRVYDGIMQGRNKFEETGNIQDLFFPQK